MFPIPKNLNITKIVIQIDISSPRLELAKIKEKTKNKKAKRLIKNKSMKTEDLGSVK